MYLYLSLIYFQMYGTLNPISAFYFATSNCKTTDSFKSINSY